MEVDPEMLQMCGDDLTDHVMLQMGDNDSVEVDTEM